MPKLSRSKNINKPEPVVTGAYTEGELLGMVGWSASIWYSIAGQAECKCGTIEGIQYGRYGDGSPRPEHDALVLVDPHRTVTLEYTHSEITDQKWEGGEPPPGHLARREKGVWYLFRIWRADGKEIGSIEPVRHYIPVRRIQKIERKDAEPRSFAPTTGRTEL